MTDFYRPVEEVIDSEGKVIRMAVHAFVHDDISAVFTVDAVDLMLAWQLASVKTSKMPAFDLDTNAPIVPSFLERYRALKLIENSDLYPVQMPKIDIARDQKNPERYEFRLKPYSVALISALMNSGVESLYVCANVTDRNGKIDLSRVQEIFHTEDRGKIVADMIEPKENSKIIEQMPRFFTSGLPLQSLARHVDDYALLLAKARVVQSPDASVMAEAERRMGLYDSFDACRDIMDDLVCAGVPGVSLTSYNSGADTLLALIPLAATVHGEIQSPTGSPLALINRFALMMERLERRAQEANDNPATPSSLERLQTMLVPLGRAVLKTEDKNQVALTRQELSETANRALDWLRKYPNATMLPAENLLPSPRRNYGSSGPVAG